MTNNKKVIDLVRKVAVCAVAVGFLFGCSAIASNVGPQEATVLSDKFAYPSDAYNKVTNLSCIKIVFDEAGRSNYNEKGSVIGLSEVKATPAFFGKVTESGAEQERIKAEQAAISAAGETLN